MSEALKQLIAAAAAVKDASMFDKADAAERLAEAVMMWAILIERRLQDAGK